MIRTYPSSRPRILAEYRIRLGQVREAYAAASLVRQLLHCIRSVAVPGNGAVRHSRRGGPSSVEGSRKVLGARPTDPNLVGFISSPGQNQRMVMVDPNRPRVVKLSVQPDESKSLLDEIDQIETLPADGIPHLVDSSSTRRTTSRGWLVLEGERVSGEIPRWTSRSNRQRASRAGRSICDVPRGDRYCAHCAEHGKSFNPTGLPGPHPCGTGTRSMERRLLPAGEVRIFDWEFARADVLSATCVQRSRMGDARRCAAAGANPVGWLLEVAFGLRAGARTERPGRGCLDS